MSAGPESRFGHVLAWAGDRLNPILVREVNQALNGRGLVVTGGFALLAVVIIALVVAAQGQGMAGEGGKVFAGTLLVLMPILLFVVPMQAFQSMRREVTRGTADHLHLSRLRPGAIVRGKLAATMVQFVLYFSIFAPLLAMTYLLRGVDVPTIAVTLVLHGMLGVAACAFAVACGALCRWPSVFRVLPLIGVIVGLGTLTSSAMSSFGVGMMFRTRMDLERLFEPILYIAPPVLAGVVLCALIGAAALAHPHENRSSAFRVFALTLTIAAFSWILGTRALDPPPAYTAGSSTWIAWVAIGCAVCLWPFSLLAATEESGLSPRVRSRVPRNRALALLVLPLLPGGGRGVLFGAVLAATTIGVGGMVAALGPPGTAEASTTVGAGIAWMYVLIYCGAAGLLRGFLPRGLRWSWVARGAIPLVLMLGTLLPFLVDAVTQGHLHQGRSVFDFLNPLLVHRRYAHRPAAARQLGVALAVVWGLITIVDMRRIVASVREVLAASKARRNRAR